MPEPGLATTDAAQPPRGSSPRTRWLIGALAALLWSGYAVPLFAPPPAVVSPMPLDPTLWERVFPGVPGEWILVRLLWLFSAVLISWPLMTNPFGGGVTEWLPARPPRAVAPRWLGTAFSVALAHALAGLWVDDFSRAAQRAYVVAFALPTLALAIGTRRAATAAEEGMPPPGSPAARLLDPAVAASMAAVACVIGLWGFLAAWPAWHSAWMANGVDFAMNLKALARTADPDFNLVTGQVRPALSGLHLVFQGAGLVGREMLDSVSWVQATNMLGIAVAASGLGGLVALGLGRSAAPIAVAAFLFSPFMMMAPLIPADCFFISLMTVSLLWLAVVIRRRRSASGVAAFGALAGISVTHPAAAFVAVLIGASVVWDTVVRPRTRWAISDAPAIPWLVMAVAALSFVAAAPAMPRPNSLSGALKTYTQGGQQWVGLEAAASGLVRPGRIEFHVNAARPAWYDVPLGAALLPVAVARSPMRMTGDALFDPVSTLLALVGLVACLRWWRNPSAWAIGGIFLVAILPGFVSTYDRPSIIRLFVLPVAMAFLAAVGWLSLGRDTRRRGRGSGAISLTVAAIVVGGSWLYREVTPRVIPRSSLGLALGALGDGGGTRAAVLVSAPADPLQAVFFTTGLPAEPLPTFGYRGADSLGLPDAPVADLVFWSPGLEDEASVSSAICGLWPAAVLYTLSDESTVGRAFAAQVAGAPWAPVIPGARWRRSGCGNPLETHGRLARSALRRAHRFAEEGRGRDAIDVMRFAARRSFVEAELYQALARELLVGQPSRAERNEAIGWARRASEAMRFRGAETVATLATTLEAGGRHEEAKEMASLAAQLAEEQQRPDLARSMTDLRERLEANPAGGEAAANQVR